ncbi:MAG TPA: DUF2382 domain-containing protein [Longimicrobium sp.]|nr:DUF2382 domain-containing protein [Longimicrobium sp.]
MGSNEMDRGELDRVVPLNQLPGYEVADDDPDVRGWDVISADGRGIGRVDQLLVDTGAMKVRHLDVDLDDTLAGDRHALIPIGYARLDPVRRRVFVDALNATQVAALPAYGHGPVTRDMDDEFHRPFAAAPRTGGDAREARIVRHEEQLAIGKRRTESGEVQVHKYVETEHVRRPVRLAHEEVTVERHPVTDPATLRGREARVEGGEIHVPLMAEEAVVEKRVVPREELVVRKREVQEPGVVEADLRKERIEVDRQDQDGSRR